MSWYHNLMAATALGLTACGVSQKQFEGLDKKFRDMGAIYVKREKEQGAETERLSSDVVVLKERIADVRGGSFPQLVDEEAKRRAQLTAMAMKADAEAELRSMQRDEEAKVRAIQREKKLDLVSRTEREELQRNLKAQGREFEERLRDGIAALRSDVAALSGESETARTELKAELDNSREDLAQALGRRIGKLISSIRLVDGASKKRDRVLDRKADAQYDELNNGLNEVNKKNDAQHGYLNNRADELERRINPSGQGGTIAPVDSFTFNGKRAYFFTLNDSVNGNKDGKPFAYLAEEDVRHAVGKRYLAQKVLERLALGYGESISVAAIGRLVNDGKLRNLDESVMTEEQAKGYLTQEIYAETREVLELQTAGLTQLTARQARILSNIQNRIFEAERMPDGEIKKIYLHNLQEKKEHLLEGRK